MPGRRNPNSAKRQKDLPPLFPLWKRHVFQRTEKAVANGSGIRYTGLATQKFRPALSWIGSAGLMICFDSLHLTRGTALSVTFGASSPTGGAEGARGTDEGDPCGCIRRRRAAEDSGPYGRDSSHSVGADVPIRPECLLCTPPPTTATRKER